MKRLLLATLALSGSLEALAVEADSVRRLEELTITGQMRQKEGSLSKLAVPVRDLPIVLNDLSGAQLKLRGINKLETALKAVPNVNVRTTYGGFNQIVIRGFDHSILMVDGMRDERSALVNSYPTGDLSSVERIEVLKGPASVLYGYSVVGGVVNIVRHQPSEERLLRVGMRYGSWDYHDLNINAGGKLLKGLNYHVGGFYSGGDQWRDTKDKRRSLYGALGYTLGKHQFVWRLGYRNDFYGTEAGLPRLMPEDMYQTSDDQLIARKHTLREGLDRSKRYNNSSDFLYNKSFSTSLRWSYNISKDWKLVNTYSYAWDDIDYLSTEFMTHRQTTTANRYTYYSKDAQGTRTYWDLDNLRLDQHLRFEHVAHTIANQLDLTGKFSTGAIKHNVLVGLNFSRLRRYTYTGYQQGDISGPGYFSLINTLDPKDSGHINSKFSRVTAMRATSQGIYASDVLELTPQLKAMLAMRYDWYRLRGAGARIEDGKHLFALPEREAYEGTRSGSISYRVGLVYNPLEELSLFASLGSFYIPDRTLSFRTDRVYYGKDGRQITEFRDGRIFDPQTGYQYELGLKYELTNRLSVLLSAFNTLRRGEVLQVGTDQIPAPTPTRPDAVRTVRVMAQAGQTRSGGFELEIKYAPIRNLQLSAGYGYTRARLAELEENELTKRFPSVRKGAKLPYIPAHNIYSYGQYELDRGALQGLNLNYMFTYRSRMYYNMANDLSFNPMTQLDLGASYRFASSWQVGLQVKNVLNYKGYSSVMGTQLFPNEPTNFVASLTYQL